RAAEPRDACEREQDIGGRPKEERIEAPAITSGERVHGVRQREDAMTVRNGQQIGAAGGEPTFLDQRLTLGTMAVATGVVGDSHGTAPVTRLPMPAQEGGATGRDRPERHVLDLREAVRLTIPIAMGPHDVRKLEPRRG